VATKKQRAGARVNIKKSAAAAKKKRTIAHLSSGVRTAIEAALEAKKAGKLRYIGFTGHKSPQIHLHMLQTADRYGFTFDTVQMPLNVMDAHFDSFEQMGSSGAGKTPHRRTGDEDDGRRQLPAQRYRHSPRMPALLDESADERGHHALRLDADIGAGAGCRAHFFSAERCREAGASG
jgi:hypothetical protein